MLIDALRAYVQIATGLTEVTREKATAVAKQLAAQPGEVIGGAAASAASAMGQVQSFTEEIILTSRDNRALLLGIIRTEVERAVAALGFAKEAEIDAVRHKVDKLEEAVGLAEDQGESPSLRAALNPTKKKAPAKKAPAKKAVTKKAVTKKAVTKKAPAKKAAAKKVAATKSPVAAAAAPPAPAALEVPVPAPHAALVESPTQDPLAAAAFEASVLEAEAAVEEVPVAPTADVVDLEAHQASGTPA